MLAAASAAAFCSPHGQGWVAGQLRRCEIHKCFSSFASVQFELLNLKHFKSEIAVVSHKSMRYLSALKKWALDDVFSLLIGLFCAACVPERFINLFLVLIHFLWINTILFQDSRPDYS